MDSSKKINHLATLLENLEKMKTLEWKKKFRILFPWMWGVQSDILFDGEFGQYYAFRDILIVCELSRKISIKFIIYNLDELICVSKRGKRNCYQRILCAVMYIVLAIVTDCAVPWWQFLYYMDVKNDDEISACNFILRKVLTDSNYMPVSLQTLQNFQNKYHRMNFDMYYEEMHKSFTRYNYSDKNEEFEILFPKQKCESIFLQEND